MKSHVQVATRLTKLLDEQFKIGNFKVGLDPIIGLVPGVGDMISFALSLYIIWIGVQVGLPDSKVGVMVRNVVIDFLFGLFPVIGDIADVAYKANSRNMRLIHEHLGLLEEGKIVLTQ